MGFYSQRKQEMRDAAEEATRTGDTSRARQLMKHTLSESEGDDVIEQMKSVVNETKKEERS
ncbi:hypothetical protein F4561_002710 [Lipingzhangella halophila]|uniref:Uncharacterized protein n=1 Tax=Lipingzhangella halophila TaxID=1783352 RepID=A0A7W7W3N1_9ACTN|nr:hypothetical protein [Lipingzhangella halophila]MBB4931890.1 hypothetical protein [Lipingzhangella halophila]